MEQPVKPIFLISMPRSGSTLLQRILGRHPAITTAAEPWLMLPLASTLRSQGIYTNYDQNAVVDAVRDFYEAMPSGRENFTAGLRTFAIDLYQQHTEAGAQYFLDKTPRYHLIIDELIEIFPDARFIFLWRNPLSIISSMLDTWHRGHWYLFFFKVDLFDGWERMHNAFHQHKDRIFNIRYEDLLSAPQEKCKDMCVYLDIPFRPNMVEDFQSVQFSGEMGDPTGIKDYQAISEKPLEKWKRSLRNPIRKRWCKSYLKWLGQERLQDVGYDLQDILHEMRSIPFSFSRMGGDIARITYGFFYQLFELRLFQDKLKVLPKYKRIHPHL